jgi:hypothetical protein
MNAGQIYPGGVVSRTHFQPNKSTSSQPSGSGNEDLRPDGTRQCVWRSFEPPGLRIFRLLLSFCALPGSRDRIARFGFFNFSFRSAIQSPNWPVPFATSGEGNIGVEVDCKDPLVNGSITPTLEPDTTLLLGSGLPGLAALVRCKCVQRA